MSSATAFRGCPVSDDVNPQTSGARAVSVQHTTGGPSYYVLNTGHVLIATEATDV